MPVRSLLGLALASYRSGPALRSVFEAPQQPVVVILGPLIPTTLSYINANFIEHYFDVTVVSLTNDATKHEFDDGDDSE